MSPLPKRLAQSQQMIPAERSALLGRTSAREHKAGAVLPPAAPAAFPFPEAELEAALAFVFRWCPDLLVTPALRHRCLRPPCCNPQNAMPSSKMQ
jgi:hypothetical protein